MGRGKGHALSPIDAARGAMTRCSASRRSSGGRTRPTPTWRGKKRHRPAHGVQPHRLGRPPPAGACRRAVSTLVPPLVGHTAREVALATSPVLRGSAGYRGPGLTRPQAPSSQPMMARSTPHEPPLPPSLPEPRPGIPAAGSVPACAPGANVQLARPVRAGPRRRRRRVPRCRGRRPARRHFAIALHRRWQLPNSGQLPVKKLAGPFDALRGFLPAAR